VIQLELHKCMTDYPRPASQRLPFRVALAGALAVVALVVALAGWKGRDREAAGVGTERVAAPPRPRPISAPDSSLLRLMAERGDSLRRLRSLIVAWRGDVVLERYYNGATRTSPANIKSASKTIVSALVGIAIARGELSGPTQRIDQVLGPETQQLEEAKRSITLADLLTMRSGLESTSFENYGEWVSSRNWVRDALRRPVVAEKGEGGPMIYSTGNSHLLSAIITRATRTSTQTYADRHLFRPMGVRLRGWTTDPQGVYFGGNEMRLTPREMLAFGELYRNKGQVRDADSVRQIIPQAWIDSSWVTRTRSGWSGNEYGYGWWMRDFRGYRAYFAWGYGGQYIFVLPALDATVVMTSDANVMSREEGHRAELFRMIEENLVPALGG
jgi:CubicO group peptidase (beta-lactamase class C family)